jgi:signal transduction histidine kinase
MWLMVPLAAWSLIYGVQLGYGSRANQLIWQRLGLAVGGTVPPLWLLFTLQYFDREAWLSGRWRLALAAEPLLFGLLTLTNHVHHLIWQDSAMRVTSVVQMVELSFGWGYYAHMAFAYLLVIGGLAQFLSFLQRTNRLHRRQTALVVMGVIPPFAGNIAYTFQVTWGPLPALDPTPFLFVFTGLFWSLALFEFDLLKRTPFARQRIIDEMGDGLIVLNTARTIVNTNLVADRVFDPTPPIGEDISDLLESVPAVSANTLAELDGATVTARFNEQQHAYDVDCLALTDDQSQTVGHMIALRDVTERDEYEQRLEVAQRILRHNLRNDMTVIHGAADYLVDETSGEAQQAATRIYQTANEIIDLSEKTHTMARMETSVTEDRTPQNIHQQLLPIIEDFEARFPAVEIEHDLPESLAVSLHDEMFLLTPVENLIENAIEHNEGPETWVGVRAESHGHRVRIIVEDNGPKIPAVEQRMLEQEAGDALNHGTGLGLWLTYWSVTTVGGEMDFAYTPRTGNTVTIELPASA